MTHYAGLVRPAGLPRLSARKKPKPKTPKSKTRKAVRPLAIYHLSIKIVTRGKGKSAVAAAAYRAGEIIKNEYDGVIHDFTKKRGIAYTEIMLPANAPAEFADRSTLWNAVEKIEKQCNAQLAREVEIALPAELNREQQIALAQGFVKETFVSQDMAADLAIHDKGDGNPHCHILLTVRPFNADKTWGAKIKKVNGKPVYTTNWNDRDNAEIWRRTWAAYANGAMRLAGVLSNDNAIDHRSYKRQGVEQIPTVHLGPYASGLEKRGIHTEVGDRNREIEMTNQQIRQLRARINRLKDWLDNEAANPSPPTPFDVVSGLLRGDPDRSNFAKIIDLQMAAKAHMFFEKHDVETLQDMRGKLGDFYDEQRAMSEKLQPMARRIKTLDLLLRHCDNFAKYRKLAKQRDALFAEAHRLDSQSVIFKGKAKEALEKAEAYEWQNLNAIRDYEAAEKYLRGVLQKRFDPAKLPIAKWRQERDTLARELGGLTTEFNILKAEVRQAEQIHKCAENIQSAISAAEREPQMRGQER